ncbi:saccharopine dehydrogenase C-terminal domain-containing protein [Permianibacter aggregans]|uniref:Saccharopine dehydrogenase (NADP+, L-glutamate forming) n=1 Tax=Permianibacter aggregans TaxID=1510150 RepID=A0A4R6UK82_9GAMM|nr:saccharopine dehydrogenase C-terminal domain-containing protein [Permianibacter aggregans]QGX40950.1 saccharopine dehydrogenase [Permianibacter aggregans]TDQ43614.1 saccharopine dehydrogenase (NADP+, L-glutamate forming) [Permianibacter aggregans]
MARILVLGAGFVAGPLVSVLMRDPKNELTLASQFLREAEKLAAGRSRVNAAEVNVQDASQLGQLVADHDVVVSLVPYQFHVLVARQCIAHRRHLVTASYENAEIKALNAEAKSVGITILNEIGLDPGIDHLSAMKIIDEVHAEHGKVLAFESWCGGLPSPTSNNNPFGYKFSWAPRSVLQALLNSATYLKDGELIHIPAENLLRNPVALQVDEHLQLEGYPNRDSVGYREVYGLREVQTMLRGTLRYPGFCAMLDECKAVGLLDVTPNAMLQPGQPPVSWNDWLAAAMTVNNIKVLSLETEQALAWLGMRGEQPMPQVGTVIDAFCQELLAKLRYAPGETDMVVLQHRFLIQRSNGEREWRYSTLICEGEPNGPTAMAKTVGIPCALAVQLLLDGGIARRGSILPVTPEIYQPILAQLGNEGIRCEESVLMA